MLSWECLTGKVVLGGNWLKRVKLSRESMPNFNLPFSQNILSCILPVIRFYDFALFFLVPKAHFFFQILIGHRVAIKRYTK